MKNLENNKLIADFMNVQPIQYDEHYQWSDGVFFSVSGLEKDKVLQHIYKYVKYASSWDWLMPVIDKITSLDEYVEFKNDTSSMVDEGGVYINTRFIENTYNETVEFIKWYNKNK